MNERKTRLYVGIFCVLVFVLLAGCRTTGSTTLSALTDHQAGTAVAAERIVEESAGIVADLKAIEPTAGSLEPVIRAVRVKAEKLETSAVALTESLAVEREITTEAREAVAETEEKADRYERQRNTLGGIFAGMILILVAIGAVFFVKKRGFL